MAENQVDFFPERASHHASGRPSEEDAVLGHGRILISRRKELSAIPETKNARWTGTQSRAWAIAQVSRVHFR